MSLSSLAPLLVAILVLSHGATLRAAGVFGVVTFDERPFQSVDGLEVAGVTFSYTIDDAPSPEAFFGSFGPGQLNHVNDPSLLGDAAGVLRMDFDEPVVAVSFGVALNKGEDIDAGVVVTMLNEQNASLDALELDTVADDPLRFSEARFDYVGAPVAAIELRFTSSVERFAVDNLEFSIPEPASLSTIVGAVTVAAARRRRRNSRRVA